VTYGQFARGISLSFVEPYLLDYRIALGLDTYYRQQLANSFISYGTQTLGFSPRIGLTLREDLSVQLRYSIYEQKISLPSSWLIATTPSPTPISPSIRRRHSWPPTVEMRLAQWTRPALACSVSATANPRSPFARSWPPAKH